MGEALQHKTTTQQFKLQTTRTRSFTTRFYATCNLKSLDVCGTKYGGRSDCQACDLEHKDLRYRELYHEQVSATLAFQLKRLFPEAQVYRDFQLHHDSRIRQILTQLENVESAKPDVLMVFWNSTVGRVSIAFEFERTAKVKNRLQHKLKSYCSESRLDGVVYIGSSDQIISNLQDIYRERVLEKSNRIRFYGNNFLLCSTFTGNILGSLSVCLNAEMKTLRFADGVRVLVQTKDEDRRNSLFD